MGNELYNSQAIYIWLRSRQLDGTYPGEGPEVGTWVTSAMRGSRGWGIIDRQDWTYHGEWPPEEPPNLDALAKKGRIRLYQRVRSAAECLAAAKMMGGAGAFCGFEMTDEWFNAPNGVIPMPQPGNNSTVGHCVFVMKEPNVDRFMFPNSWGEDWGDRGWGYMTYECFDKCMAEAWFQWPEKATPCQLFDMCMPLDPKVERSGVHTFGWVHEDLIFNRKTYVMEVYDASADERMAWAFALDTGRRLEIEEFFVMPRFREQGCGTALMKMLLDTQKLVQRPVLMWIPHPDCTPNQWPITESFLQKHGFHITGSGVRWATARATLGEEDSSTPAVPISDPPCRPAILRGGPPIIQKHCL